MDAAKKNFDPATSVWARNPSLVSSNSAPQDESIAQYTGGLVKVNEELRFLITLLHMDVACISKHLIYCMHCMP